MKNNIQPQQNKKKPVLKKKNRLVFVKTNFADFDPATGDKVAGMQDLALAKMEALSEAKKSRTDVNDTTETLKDIGTGGSISYLLANPIIQHDSKSLKFLTAGRKRGIIGILGGVGAGILSARRQKAAFNKQQAARELLVGKNTQRARAYKQYLQEKYLNRKQ